MSSYGGGGGKNRALYGVWIDEAVKSNDANQMKEVLKAVRGYFHENKPQPLYGVWVDQAIQRGASKEELQGLLEAAKATASSDLQGAIKKLETHLSKK